jgi:integrase
MPKIKTIELADGSKRYRFTADVGADPVTSRRRQRTYTFRRMKDARAELGRLTGAVADGTFVDRSRETLSQALDKYLASAVFERSANTAASYRNCLLPVRERLGHRKLQSITRADIEQLRDWMLAEGRKRGGEPGTGLGAPSVRQTLGRLRAALELACMDGRLAVNPARYVRMPAMPRREGTTWSAEQLRAFLRAADADRLAALWRLTAYGLRRGEVLGLKWDDIDTEARTVTVRRSRVLVEGKVIEKSPKSKRGWRTLPLDAGLVASLRSLHKAQAAERLAAGKAYRASGYLAVDAFGVPLAPFWYSAEFHRLADAAGCPRIRLHDSRHSVNSLMAAVGVPPHIRAAWCGHTEMVNQAVYTHCRPEDLDAAGAALSAFFSAV